MKFKNQLLKLFLNERRDGCPVTVNVQWLSLAVPWIGGDCCIS